MINAQNLAVLLRALRQGEASPRSLPITARVARTLPVLPVSTEDGSSPALRAAVDSPLAQSGRAERPSLEGVALPGPDGHGEERPSARAAGGERPLPASEIGGTTTAGPRSVVAGSAVPSTQITLSSVGEILREVLSSDAPASAPVVRPQRPLTDASPREAEPLARGIEAAVTRSGLFYESHVAQWAAERYPIQALREEPQAALAPAPSDAVSAPTTQGAPTHEPSVALVRQQLEALDTRQIVVQAELWPGQRVRLAFEEEGSATDAPAHGGDEASRVWHTRITIDLPSLGTIEATVAIDGAFLRCALRARTEAAATRLGDAKAELTAAVRDAGLGALQCEVHHGTTS